MIEAASGRVNFLECGVAPLVGAGSAFAVSLAAAGSGREEQLLLGEIRTFCARMAPVLNPAPFHMVEPAEEAL